jgi:hypothetical protein
MHNRPLLASFDLPSQTLLSLSTTFLCLRQFLKQEPDYVEENATSLSYDS